MVVLAFFGFAKSNSELDFLGLFHAKQGQEASLSDKPEANIKPETPSTATVIGSIVINGRNVSAEDVKQVRVKDQTAVQPARLSNNRFVLREVEIPRDRLLEIAIDLNDGRSPSQLFKLPQANKENTIDLREVLLEAKQISVNQRKTGQRNNPTIIIRNQNIQTN
ncbi:hypothetical protein HNV11_19915 [Spirosoma taeanense]|uniref:Uncharacterized protein n=1 Tax=Spirosoma taeanense TaxID=2735870 RepID=A0A6M5YD23_9BACT|nr:hypothetical protein [Spirosoma taeanense]QJW91484.1 hypothetical protein HNV11_19915 [Spirosoma taeanense]